MGWRTQRGEWRSARSWRYAGLFQQIEEARPFWPELAELMRRCRAAQWITEGATVRPWPHTQDVGVQAGTRRPRRNAGIQTGRYAWDEATQTDAVDPAEEARARARVGTREVATQIGAGSVRRGVPDPGQPEPWSGSQRPGDHRPY